MRVYTIGHGTRPTDELVELTFNALQTSTHVAQEREHETVGLVGHDRGKIGCEDGRVKCGCPADTSRSCRRPREDTARTYEK